MKKYKVSYPFNLIDTISIDRETNSFIFLAGTGEKVAKHSGYYGYFDTFEAAKKSLINRLKTEIDLNEFRLEQAKNNLAYVEQIKDPGC